jgi:hypothetical protein
MALPYVVRVPGESFSPLDSSPFQWRRGGCCLPGSSLRSVRDLENLSSADESPDQGRGEVTKSEVVRSLGRMPNRTSVNYSDVLRQVRELSVRRWTSMDDSVRGIFAGSNLTAKSDHQRQAARGHAGGFRSVAGRSPTTARPGARP